VRELPGNVGHGKRSHDPVEHREAHEEKRGREQVDGDVVQPRAHPRRARAVKLQPIRGSEHHLEEHEQVEQVSGQKGAVQAHQLDLEERMKVHARA
jgi:hypothetical protein